MNTGWLIGGFLLIPVWPTFFGIIASIACFVKYGKQVKEHRLFEQFHRFCSVIGRRGRVPLKELKNASPSGTSMSDVRDALQRMLYRGYFGAQAYIDINHNELVLPDMGGDTFVGKAQSVVYSWRDALGELLDAFRGEQIFQDAADVDDLSYRPAQPEREDESRPQSVHEAFAPLRQKAHHVREQVHQLRDQAHQMRDDIKREFSAKEPIRPAAYAQPQPEPAKPKPEPAKSQPKPQPKKRTYADELDSALNELYQLNEDISHEGVSQRIDRIGTLTAGIFRVVIEKPEREQDVRKFMNYYLPTTLKLLRSYRMLEQQGYQSESIVESRKKIEGILDTLIQGYEKLLDRLFRDDAMDIATDVDVLETMMASDGLM